MKNVSIKLNENEREEAINKQLSDILVSDLSDADKKPAIEYMNTLRQYLNK